MADSTDYLARLPIDHDVSVTDAVGGAQAAVSQLRTFIDFRMGRYDGERNQPEVEAASGLSPWLHFGHISAHEVFAAVADATDWNPGRLSDSTMRGIARLVGYRRERRGVFWTSSLPGETGLQQVQPRVGLRPIRVAAGMGSVNTGLARAGSQRARVFATRVRVGPDPRQTCGTPPSGNWSLPGGCTTTCGCCGARRSWSGRRRRSRRWRR